MRKRLRMAFREIHTSPETGQWFSFSGHFASNEVSPRRVEGSLFEIRSIEAGRIAVIKDSDGNVVSRDRGVIRPTILFEEGLPKSCNHIDRSPASQQLRS